MQSIILSHSNGSIQLLGEGIDGPFGLELDGQISPQISPFFRAQHVKLFSRKNRIIVIRFDAHRKHASVQAAQDYLLTEADTMPDEDGMTLQITPYGQNATRYYLTTPFVTAFPARHVGIRTIHRYEIKGGNITTSPN